jgi:hypothetical protein
MKRFFLTALILLSACTSMQEHYTKPFDTQFTVAGDYQAVYAATLRVMRQCLNPGGGYFLSPVTEQMSADLYPDLGYAEITRYQANMVAVPWSTTRFERHGKGTLVLIKTSSQAKYAQRYTRAWLVYWAKGGTDCAQAFDLPPNG